MLCLTVRVAGAQQYTRGRAATDGGGRVHYGGVVEDGGTEMKVEVVCYSGYKGDERPVRFRLGGQDYFVEELLDQWYGPQNIFFKVRASDGNVYILQRRSSVPEGEWSLESFRDMRRGG